MIIAKQRGFTIIELMLFLAISGALFAALMIGVGSSITQQQYRESVTSYSALLQAQYSEAANIHNDRTNDFECTDGTITQPNGGGEARGTTDCMILGRAIQITDQGTNIVTSSVIGTEPATNDYLDTGDIASLVAYQPKIASYDSQTDPVNWGSTLVTTSNKPSSALILILRSPASGLIRLFVTPTPDSDLSKNITAANASTTLVNCVKGDSLLQPTQSVNVNPLVSGADSITIDGSGTAC